MVRPKPASHKQCIDELEELLTTKYSGQSGIIYSTSIKDTQKLTKDLRSRGLKVGCYHADLSPEARSKCHQKWISNYYQAVIATIAFGMGMDKPDVRFVIHHSISRSMANFYQESGRAGRDDSPAECILYFRFGDLFRISAMVFAEATGLENLYGMVSYCIDSKRCRRHIIAEHFEEIRESVDCDKMCDHCRYPKTVKLVDITNYTQDLGKVLSNAKAAHQNVTGPKLVDAWLGKGQSNLKVAGLKAPPLGRESCENVVSYLLLEGFLKEDFHFTPYNTISYVLAGPRMNSVVSGKTTVTMELPGRSLVTSKPATPLISKNTHKVSSVSSVDQSLISSNSEMQKVANCETSRGKQTSIEERKRSQKGESILDDEGDVDFDITVHRKKIKKVQKCFISDSSDDECRVVK